MNFKLYATFKGLLISAFVFLMVTPLGAAIIHRADFSPGGDEVVGGQLYYEAGRVGWKSNVVGDDIPTTNPQFVKIDDSVVNFKEGSIRFVIERQSEKTGFDYESVLSLVDDSDVTLASFTIVWEREPGSETVLYFLGIYENPKRDGLWDYNVSIGKTVPRGNQLDVLITWGPQKGMNRVYADGRQVEISYNKRVNLYNGSKGGDAKTFDDYFAGRIAKVLVGTYSYNKPGGELVYEPPMNDSILWELQFYDKAITPGEIARPVISSITDDTFSVPGISGMITTGDIVHVRLEAEPGGTASFDMGEVTGIPMAEVMSDITGEGAGVYEGSYTVMPGDDYEDGRIVGHFLSAAGVEADPVSASNRWTIDTKTILALEIDKDDLPADEVSKTKIKVTVSDVNGEPVRDHQIRLDLSTTEEYTGLVGAGDFGENVGAEVEATWKTVTDSWGEVEFDYRSGFAAKTVIVTAKDLTTGSVGVGYITSYIDALIDVALTAPVSKAAARRGILYYMEVEASRAELTADGRSRSVIRAYVYDPNGNPVEGDSVEFTLDQENGELKTIKAVTDKNGRATAEYRAGKKIGIVQVTATNVTRGLTGYVSITLLSDAPAKIYLAARPESLPADGFSRSDIEVKVTDINDNPNEDTEVLFSLEKGAGEIRKDLLVTDRYGEATNTFVSGKEPGLVTIKATVKSKIPTEKELDMVRNVLFAPYSDLDDEMRLEKWLVRKGEEVKEGDPLCRYSIRGENFTLTAPCDLEIKELLAESWDYLEVGQTLATVIPIDEP